MYEGTTSFSPFTFKIDEGKEIVLNKDVDEVSSVTKVFSRYREHSEELLFTVLNASLNVFAERGGTGILVASHSFAQDVEGDASRTALFDVDSMVMQYLHGRSVTFKGYITSAHFYDPAGLSPFTDAVKDESDEYGANFGYPYNPPKVTFERYSFPLAVEVRHTFINTEDSRKHSAEMYL